MISAEQFYEVIWKRHLKKYNIDAYTYLPYGSSKFNDLACIISTNDTSMPLINCILNDQEPLNITEWTTLQKRAETNQHLTFWQNVALHRVSLGILSTVFASFNGKVILAHSELYSKDLDHIVQNCDVIPVYYWWHGLVARQWFNVYRFDPAITYTVEPDQQRFLLYCRAFTGTREYRLKLLDQLVKRNVYPYVKLNFHPEDGDLHYTNHTYSNKKFTCYSKLENYFVESKQWESSASASIDVADFRSTRISIVAETVFEDKVWFSEKILKAIAAGHPFVLLCGAHSLEVLRGYGFKTFGDFWDESYDLVEDGYDRLIIISKLLEKLAAMPQDEFDSMCIKMKEIVDYNQQWFYSKEFEDVLMNELDNNFSVVQSIKPAALGADTISTSLLIINQFPHYAKEATDLLVAHLASCQKHYPEVYNTVMQVYAKEIATLLDSKEPSEEQ